MCDLHSQVTREVLVQLAPPPRSARSSGGHVSPGERGVARVRGAPPAGDEPGPRDRGRWGRGSAAARLAAGAQRAAGRRQALSAQGAPAVHVPGAPRHHRPFEGDVGEGRRDPGTAEGSQRRAARARCHGRRVEASGGHHRRRRGGRGPRDDLQGGADPPSHVPGEIHRRTSGPRSGPLRRVTAGAWWSRAKATSRRTLAGGGSTRLGSGRRFTSDRDPRPGTTHRHLLHPAGGPHLCGCRRPRGVLLGRARTGSSPAAAPSSDARCRTAIRREASTSSTGSSTTSGRGGKTWPSSGSTLPAASCTSATSP